MAQTAVAFLVALALLCGADALKAPRTWEPVVSLRQRGGETAVPLRLRGGELDMTRLRVRLESIQSYAVIASLTMNIGERMLANTAPQFDADGAFGGASAFHRQNLKMLYTVLLTLSFLSGMYATVVFALVGVYAKAALGHDLDDVCVTFLKATHHQRQNAYRCFLVSIITVTLAYPLAMMVRTKPREELRGLPWVRGPRVGLFWATLALAIYSMHEWLSINQVAWALIYSKRM